MTNLFIEFKAQRLRVQIRSTPRLTALSGTNTGAAPLLWARFASWAPWSVWGWLDLLRDCSGSCGLPSGVFCQLPLTAPNSSDFCRFSPVYLLLRPGLLSCKACPQTRGTCSHTLSTAFHRPFPLWPGAVISFSHLCAGVWHTVGIRFVGQALYRAGTILGWPSFNKSRQNERK